MKIKFKIVFFVLFVFINKLTSQNYLFNENESGFHVFGQFTSNEGSSLIGISPGYTFNGKLTMGLTLGFEEDNESDFSSNAIRPYIDYLVLKQDNNNPVSINLYGAYQHNNFPDFKDLKVNTVNLGLGIFHQLNLGTNFDLIPAGGVGWARSTANLWGASESESGINYGLSLTGKINKFYVTPGLSFSNGDTIFNLVLGVIFPK